MTDTIDIIGPKYLGAPYPDFKEKCINESEFLHAERYKYADVRKNLKGRSYVKWLSQDAELPTENWKREIIRAFKANGAKHGHAIDYEFGSRYAGVVEDGQLIVN